MMEPLRVSRATFDEIIAWMRADYDYVPPEAEARGVVEARVVIGVDDSESEGKALDVQGIAKWRYGVPRDTDFVRLTRADDGPRTLPTACPQCGALLTIQGKIEINSETRANTLTATCYEHGVVDRIPLAWNGHGFSVLVAADGQRWHEIATEGLPPRESGGSGAMFFVYRPECPVIVVGYNGPGIGAWQIGNWFPDDVTHWMPCPLPAPPTEGRL